MNWDSQIGSCTVFTQLTPLAGIDGKWLTLEECAAEGIVLSEWGEEKDGVAFRTMRLVSHAGRTFRFGGFRWAARDNSRAGFAAVPGKDLKVYLEGWTMATPCGSRSFGDCDFDYDPGYLAFAVNAPSEYSGTEPNAFRAEYMIMLHNTVSCESLLAGFVTSNNYSGRFRMKLDAQGVALFEATSGADELEVDPGDVLLSETLAVFTGTDANAMQEKFAGLWGSTMHARNTGAAPTGWCSWYFYQERITEQDLRDNVKFFADNRDRFPVRYIQLDDGYETALGDWFDCNSQFPGGLEEVVKIIRAGGFIPALWFGPFMVEENSKLLSAHPDWMIRRKDGSLLMDFTWRHGHKVAALDGTNPEVQDYLRNLYRKVRAVGFDYIKLDFMMLGQGVEGAVFHDRKASRLQAMRRGLAAIREGFGEDGFILGCTAPFAGTVGLVNGERISTDIINVWAGSPHPHDEAPTVPNVCRNVCRHGYMHRRLWLNDPDTLIVREDNTKLTEEETRLWCDAVALAGGLLLLGDNLPTLSGKRQKWAEELLKECDQWSARPADVFGPTFPNVWTAVNRKTGQKATGYFNLTEAPQPLPDGSTLPPHRSKLFFA